MKFPTPLTGLACIYTPLHIDPYILYLLTYLRSLPTTHRATEKMATTPADQESSPPPPPPAHVAVPLPPPPDTSFVEASEEFTGEGLIPD